MAVGAVGALERPTYFEVAEVLPSAMTEWEISNIPVGEASLRIARSIALDILSSGEDPLRHIREFERLYILADYSDELRSIGTLDDEVSIAHGQPLALIRGWVTERLKNFVQSAPSNASC